MRQDVRREAGFEEALGREVRRVGGVTRGEEGRGKGGFEAAVKDGLQEFGAFPVLSCGCVATHSLASTIRLHS